MSQFFLAQAQSSSGATSLSPASPKPVETQPASPDSVRVRPPASQFAFDVWTAAIAGGVISGVITGIVVTSFFRRKDKKIKDAERLTSMATQGEVLTSSTLSLSQRLAELKDDLRALDRKVDKRSDKIEAKIDKHSKKMDAHQARFQKYQEEFQQKLTRALKAVEPTLRERIKAFVKEYLGLESSDIASIDEVESLIEIVLQELNQKTEPLVILQKLEESKLDRRRTQPAMASRGFTKSASVQKPQKSKAKPQRRHR